MFYTRREPSDKEAATMPKQDPELAALEQRLAEAEAQVESLQAQTADAEARAATAQMELTQARQRLSELEAALTSARSEAEAAREEAAQARDELRQAALKYREARLAAAPETPPDLVPGGTLAEIDQQVEAAQRVVAQLRERLEEESRSSRVPVGSPPRRAPDLSALSPEEKIRLGLRERRR